MSTLQIDAAQAEVAPPEPAVEAPAPENETVPEADAAPVVVVAASETEAAPQPEGGDASTPAAAEAAKPAEEPSLVEVWRPGRPEGRRRPPRERRRERGKPGRTDAPQRTSDEAPAVAAAGEASPSGEQPAAEAPGRSGRPHRQRHRGGERQGERHGERQGERHGDRRDRPDRPPRDREHPQQRPARFERREREKAPDPNSPFAKLAALKAQLEAEAKERR